MGWEAVAVAHVELQRKIRRPIFRTYLRRYWRGSGGNFYWINLHIKVANVGEPQNCECTHHCKILCSGDWDEKWRVNPRTRLCTRLEGTELILSWLIRMRHTVTDRNPSSMLCWSADRYYGMCNHNDKHYGLKAQIEGLSGVYVRPERSKENFQK